MKEFKKHVCLHSEIKIDGEAKKEYKARKIFLFLELLMTNVLESVFILNVKKCKNL